MPHALFLSYKKEEFNLSEKQNGKRDVLMTITNENFYFEEDVKEFIKRLKEMGRRDRDTGERDFWISEKKLNELAGDKLI